MIYARIPWFLADQRGGGTVMGLLWFVLLVGITGMAVDVTNGFRNRTMLQATADAAALAAIIDLPNDLMVVDSAASYTAKNMPPTDYGSVLDPADVKAGLWNGATHSLDTSAAFPDAVMVTVRQTAVNGNPVPVNFLRIIGLTEWNVRAQAVAQRFVPGCLRDGLVARGVVDISSNNGFTNNICVHGQQGVQMQNHNSYQAGVTVSMPDPASQLVTPTFGMTSNPGLPEALRGESLDPRMVNHVSEIMDDILALKPYVIPSYINLGEGNRDPDNDGDADHDNDNDGDGNGDGDGDREHEDEHEHEHEHGQEHEHDHGHDTDADDDGPDDSDGDGDGDRAGDGDGDGDGANDSDHDGDGCVGSGCAGSESVEVEDRDDKWDFEDAAPGHVYHIVCAANKNAHIPSNKVLSQLVIVSDCQVSVGSGATLSDVVLASRAGGNPGNGNGNGNGNQGGGAGPSNANINFAANVNLGRADNCRTGGGVQIFSNASVHFSSSMTINGLQVVAAGDVDLGARAMGVNGISVQAGHDISLTSNNLFGLCSGGAPNLFTVPYYRLVL